MSCHKHLHFFLRLKVQCFWGCWVPLSQWSTDWAVPWNHVGAFTNTDVHLTPNPQKLSFQCSGVCTVDRDFEPALFTLHLQSGLRMPWRLEDVNGEPPAVI